MILRHTIRKFRSNLRNAQKSVLSLGDLTPGPSVINPEDFNKLMYVDQNLAEFAEEIQTQTDFMCQRRYAAFKSLQKVNMSFLIGALWALLPFIFRIQCDGSFFYYVNSAGEIVLIIIVFLLNALFFSQFVNLVQEFVSMVHRQYLMVKTTSDVLVKFNHSKRVVKK